MKNKLLEASHRHGHAITCESSRTHKSTGSHFVLKIKTLKKDITQAVTIIL